MILPLRLVSSIASDWTTLGSSLDAAAAKIGLTPGIRMQPAHPLGMIFEYRQGKDVYMTIGISRGSTAADHATFRQFLRFGAGAINEPQSPSGVPLGDFCFVSGGGSLISFAGEDLEIEVQMSTRHLGDERAKDFRREEAMARVAFAEALGLTMGPSDPTSPALSALAHPRRDYSTLSKALEGRSVKIDINEWGDRIALTIGGKTVEVALGSDVALVGSAKVPLDAFVARRQGVWMVPKGGILAALGAKK